MNILITGAHGFVGKNLCATLDNIRLGKDKSFGEIADINVMEYDVDTNPALLDEYCQKADFVFHLAGVNRPKEESEFMEGNFGFTSVLLDTLKKHGNKAPVMISSSIQAERDNPYGLSKKAGEDLIFAYGKEVGAKVLVYRFPNVFGKWCRPNYNSAVATFCHNVARDLPITVSDRAVVMNLIYIDDLVAEMIAALKGEENRQGDYCYVGDVHTVTLGEIVDLIYSFRDSRKQDTAARLSVADSSNPFAKKLYATYLSYIPVDECCYDLKMNCDDRGSFTEIIRTFERGQFSVNISKPGITKGNHWHHTKNEKFVVVSGKGVIRLRRVGLDENGDKFPVCEYFVSGDKIQVVDIPVGCTHNIENLGDTDMVTFMWCNECFDPNRPDTFFEEV